MDIDYKKIGIRIQGLREYQGMTVTELANKTHFTSKSILLVENGRATISVDFLIALCDALEVTPNDILQGEFKMPESSECDEEELINGFIERLDEIKQTKNLGKTVIKGTDETIAEIQAMVKDYRELERKKEVREVDYRSRHFEV